jgi:hypothetical protein
MKIKMTGTKVILENKTTLGFWKALKQVKLFPVDASGTRKLHKKTQCLPNSCRNKVINPLGFYSEQ